MSLPNVLPEKISTESEYEAALKEIQDLVEALPGTMEAKRFNQLITLVEAYEDIHYPIN